MARAFHAGCGKRRRIGRGFGDAPIPLAKRPSFGSATLPAGNPAHLTTAMGLLSAGLAFALQKPISAIAGYLVILRGRTFHVGDRILMGDVRGEVIAVGFIQTTIMEMGEPPGEQADEPAMWVKGRQFSGRVVTVSNSMVFDKPVYNYTRDFPYYGKR